MGLSVRRIPGASYGRCLLRPILRYGLLMDLDFQLQLAERLVDRVFVLVRLAPKASLSLKVEEVALVLLSATGERLSHQLVLPLSGRIEQDISMTVELRALAPLPYGSVIQGTVWTDHREVELQIPADPGTQLEDHCRGRVMIRPDRDPEFPTRLKLLSCEEKSKIHQAYTWMKPCPLTRPAVVDQEVPSDLRTCCQDLGLDDEDADWLEELLAE